MKRIVGIVTLVAALSVAALGVAAAQDEEGPDGDEWAARGPAPWDAGPMGGGGGPMGRGGVGFWMLGPEGRLLRGGGRLAKELELTPAQQEKLSGIGVGLARKEIQLRADLALARLDLAQVLKSGSPTQSEIDTKINSVTRIQGDMMKAGAAARIAARKVLTAEQLQELQSMGAYRAGKGGGPRRGGQRGNWN
jgi:Spy/CpxP family protein refolding chaperone